MPALRTSQLEQQRAEYRANIKEALEEDEDPLSAYDDFIKWTSRTFPENDHGSGLIQLLEEVTRKFKDDARYSGDLRYLKLWCSYAKMTEKPALVYAYLVKREIGCVYGLLWEEYALVLEKEGRYAAELGQSSEKINYPTQTYGRRQGISNWHSSQRTTHRTTQETIPGFPVTPFLKTSVDLFSVEWKF